MKRILSNLTLLLVASMGLVSCGGGETDKPVEKRPRPVTIFRLEEIDTAMESSIAGSVGAWKTEDLGFEIEGRVEFVIEPGMDVSGAIFDDGGNPLTEPTVLGRLDPTRYELKRSSVLAQIEMTNQQIAALQIEVDKVIPAQRQAAEAKQALDVIEVERNSKLVSEGAGPQRDLDLAKASLEETRAGLLQIDASIEAKKAEIESLNAKLEDYNQSLRIAERDIADCSLTAPYRGQVAEVHAIPGAYRQRGEKVVTVQMMDPIKVDFEVSAEGRRGFRSFDMIPIQVPLEDGTTVQRDAFVYVTDSVADPQTRTFTVTLLTRNEKFAVPIPEDVMGPNLVRTNKVWKRMTRHFLDRAMPMVAEEAIHQDEEGPFLFEVTNEGDELFAQRVLKVKKRRISLGEVRAPFLGNWMFREIAYVEDGERQTADPIVVGSIERVDGQDPIGWSGDTVVFDSQRWLLQPGDVVRVQLPTEHGPKGLYVPMNSILESSGKFSIFLADKDLGPVRQVEVTVGESFGTLRRVESAGREILSPGDRVVLDGALFLVDGETVRVTGEREVAP